MIVPIENRLVYSAKSGRFVAFLCTQCNRSFITRWRAVRHAERQHCRASTSPLFDTARAPRPRKKP